MCATHTIVTCAVFFLSCKLNHLYINEKIENIHIASLTNLVSVSNINMLGVFPTVTLASKLCNDLVLPINSIISAPTDIYNITFQRLFLTYTTTQCSRGE